MKKYILPLGVSPTITYTNYAYPVASFCHDDKYDNWLYSNYANLSIVNPNGEIKLNFIAGDAFGGVKPLRYNQNTNVKDIISDITAKVSDGWYIYTYVNYKYINMQSDLFHNILVYGIDRDQNLVYVAGYKFDKFNQYQNYVIDIDKFCKAYYDENNKNKNRYIFWKPRNEKEQFLYEDFEIQLNDYMNSRFNLSYLNRYYYNIDNMTTADGEPMEKIIIDGHTQNKYIYGLSCVEVLKNSISIDAAEGDVDLRLFRAYWEHKKIMNLRFIHFQNNKIYPFNVSLFIEKSKEIEKTARFIFNYLIKCKMTNRIPKDISHYFDDIRYKEEYIYNKFLTLIEKNHL